MSSAQKPRVPIRRSGAMSGSKSESPMVTAVVSGLRARSADLAVRDAAVSQEIRSAELVVLNRIRSSAPVRGLQNANRRKNAREVTARNRWRWSSWQRMLANRTGLAMDPAKVALGVMESAQCSHIS
jgi:hypothetical protein